MLYRENGTKYKEYFRWCDKKSSLYDYEHNGLLQHMLSNKIVNSTNPILQFVLQYYEKSIIFLLKYVDELKNFKNYHSKNR